MASSGENRRRERSISSGRLERRPPLTPAQPTAPRAACRDPPRSAHASPLSLANGFPSRPRAIRLDTADEARGPQGVVVRPAGSMATKRHGAVALAAEKRGRRETRAELCAALGDAALRERAGAAWARGERLRHEAVVLEPSPFRHGVIPGFLADPTFAEALRDELLGLDFRGRRNDLLSLRQSEELGASPEPHVAALRHALCEEFQAWLSAVTQIALEPTIDISCAKYEYTDVLLCHDDELEGRSIAFILYLVPPWEKSDGGTLDLYSTDEHFQPQQITKSLVPSWNTLVFFEVSPVSFHQVSEVLSQKCRLSVSGWFHGPSVARPPRHIEAPLARSPHIPHDHEILYEWINVIYLDMDSQAQIQEEFEERSEILLKDFLKKEKYQLLCEALENKEIQWSSRGPANKRLYEAAEEDSLPDTLKKFLQLLRSEALFLLLSNFTGLKLHFLAPSDEDEDAEEGQAADTTAHSSPKPGQEETERPTNGNPHQPHQPENIPEAQDSETQGGSGTPVCAGELRHWTHGHYTLVHDSQATEFALDLLFFCGCEDWDPEYGGFTSYIAKGEDEELLTVNPEDNCLALVYRDKETMKFVKYINHRSLARLNKHPNRTGFWDFSFVYYE
ncbi:PREDICTED: prolyl 3-hydroxylase OGFOD1 [Pseudopodoces humilis]|uniref:prolyl 3-hydroxylase OGFOD1 n=1 Tax=Pseudopodoces humilis TaxID=181119 RepID=UPI0003954F64|nr:PREDICTED: prolyl 3-hydroxylase OGFOD1 [Pseudopodoces humilis]